MGARQPVQLQSRSGDVKIGELIARVVEGLAKNGPEGDAQIEQAVRAEVGELCAAFPVYPGR